MIASSCSRFDLQQRHSQALRSHAGTHALAGAAAHCDERPEGPTNASAGSFRFAQLVAAGFIQTCGSRHGTAGPCRNQVAAIATALTDGTRNSLRVVAMVIAPAGQEDQ